MSGYYICGWCNHYWPVVGIIDVPHTTCPNCQKHGYDDGRIWWKRTLQEAQQLAR